MLSGNIVFLWLFLTLKAAAELMFLHGRNKELRNEVDELEITLLKLQHKDQLQKQIELQTQALGPVVDKLPSIQGWNSYLP